MMECYRTKWNDILKGLGDGRKMRGIHTSLCSFNPFRELVVLIVDALATAQTCIVHGIRLYSSLNKVQFTETLVNYLKLSEQERQVSEAAHSGEPKPQPLSIHLQIQDVAVQCLKAFLTRQYTKLLESLLQEEKTEGNCTKEKSTFCNQVEEDDDNSFCAEFERSLTSSYLGNDEFVSQTNEGDSTESIDCLRIMCKVPNGHVRKTTSVQLSIVQQDLKGV